MKALTLYGSRWALSEDSDFKSYPRRPEVYLVKNAGHCWRSRDELIRDVLLWIPTHGRAKAGRPARTYIQQLCEDTGCCPEDLPRAMNDREEWRERVRDIRAASTIWWWKAVIPGDTVTRLIIPIQGRGKSPEEGQRWNLAET